MRRLESWIILQGRMEENPGDPIKPWLNVITMGRSIEANVRKEFASFAEQLGNGRVTSEGPGERYLSSTTPTHERETVNSPKIRQGDYRTNRCEQAAAFTIVLARVPMGIRNTPLAHNELCTGLISVWPHPGDEQKKVVVLGPPSAIPSRMPMPLLEIEAPLALKQTGNTQKPLYGALTRTIRGCGPNAKGWESRGWDPVHLPIRKRSRR
jgi:hypothetical protein